MIRRGWLIHSAVLMCGMTIAASIPAWSQQNRAERTIDRSPHDIVILKSDTARQFRIEPLEMPKRHPIASQDPDATVIVRLLDRPDDRYQVKWSNIERIILFEQLVLTEAAGFVASERFEDAYECYRFLDGRDAEFPGLSQAWQQALIQEAGYWQSRGQFEQTLAILNEIHRRNARLPDLRNTYGSTINELVTRQIVAGNYAAARELLEQLEDRFPGHEVVRQRQDEIIEKARGAAAAARSALSAGKMAEAHEAVTNALLWWPSLDDAQTLKLELRRAYPILEVGVRELATGRGDPADWAERRSDRLLRRRLLERSGGSRAQPTYASPFGTWTAEDAARVFRLTPAIAFDDGRPISIHDVVRVVRYVDQRRQELGHAPPLVTAIDVQDEQTVKIQLASDDPSFEALLNVELVPWYLSFDDDAAGAGPYALGDRTNATVPYQIRPQYFAATASQPQMVIERRVTSAATAIRAMKLGRLVAVDRITPWDVDKFRRADGITVKTYADPTIHFLVCRGNREIGRRAEIRRALAHGINREAILRSTLMVGERDGVVIDGLVSPDSSAAPIADSNYEPRLMLTGLNAAGLSLPAARPHWVLAHPPSETARRAAAEIVRQLSLSGQGPNVELVELDPRQPAATVDWDLLYVEWTGGDPVLGVTRLIDQLDLAPLLGPSLRSALDELLVPTTRESRAARLERADQLIREQQPILSLWSIDEHLAHVDSLQGIQNRPRTLYENIEQWQLK